MFVQFSVGVFRLSMPFLTKLLYQRLQWREAGDIKRLTGMGSIRFQEDHFYLVFLTKFCNLDTIVALIPVSENYDGKSNPMFLTMLEEVF